MPPETLLLLTADLILALHVLFVVFAVLGAAAIYAGLWRSWRWVRNYWFRVLHLGSIVFVMLDAWAGLICPLTIWEMQLRNKAGDVTYSGSFIQHWLQSLLYYDAPDWVFTFVYTIFGALVLAAWFIVKPECRK